MRKPHIEPCAMCESWPLRAPEGTDVPPGARVCREFEKVMFWDNRDGCVIFNPDPDYNKRALRRRYVEKHSSEKHNT